MKDTRLSLAAVVTVLLITACGAQAAELICFEENGGGGNPRGLYNFDTSTGMIELRTTVGGNQRFFSLAQRHSDGVVFAMHVNASDLYTIDVDTGEFTFITATGLDTVADITFDPDNDKLYGLGRNTSLFYEIDPTNGSSRLIGNAAPVRSGLTFSPDGVLYGLHVFDGNLYTIDPETGQPTLVGSSGPDPGTIEDATFTSAGEMFFTDYGGNIYQIDPDNGARTLLGSTGMGSGLSGVISLDGGVDCDLIKKLKLKCRNNKLKAIVKSGLGGGVSLTIVDNGKETKVVTNNKGKAKLKKKGQTGMHVVSIKECPEFEKEVDCG